MVEIKPIFIFSLPRSGSTLLQRILMGHSEIASVTEPWLMLPFVYAFKKGGTLTEYSHSTCFAAFEDFIKNLPKGKNDYYSSLRHFVLSLYEKQCKNGEQYFLDKTPRYYYIIKEIAEIFPDAKFIFLFRNPVHTFSSILSTWQNNRLKLCGTYQDISQGPKLLTEGYEKIKDKSFAIKYEDFIINPESHLKEILKYLELDYDKSMLSNFGNQNTLGRMGDQTGVKKYKQVSTKSLEKWKSVFNTPFRKWYLKRYIRQLDKKVFDTQGYDRSTILHRIQQMPTDRKSFLQDLMDISASYLIRRFKANIFFAKNKKWSKGKYLN